MRISADTLLLDIDSGGNAEVILDVQNTSEMIDGITTRLIGLSAGEVISKPQLLPLFPDARGQITMSVGLPTSYPAGRHAVTVEVASVGAGLPPAYLDLDLVVAPRLELKLVSNPQVIRARRQARFVLQLHNTGNVAVDLQLAALDADRAVTTTFAPDSLRIEAGAIGVTVLTVRGPRMIVGAELERVVTVEATAVGAVGPLVSHLPATNVTEGDQFDDDEAWLRDLREPAIGQKTLLVPREFPQLPLIPRTDGDGTADPTDPTPDPLAALPPIIRKTTIRLRQRPIFSRGLLTALILLSIVALWASVFLLGLNQVFKGDPMTKEAPASFFAAANSTATGAGVAGGTNGADSTAAAGSAPAGALPKSGPLPPGVGAVVNGTVIAANDKKPVGRILVEALRSTNNGLQLVSSAATQQDGSYSLAGLFPTSYLIRFSAAGYKTVWYPAAPTQAGAQPIAASAAAPTRGVNATITGLPASIQGNIDPGDTIKPVTATVSARSLSGNSTAVVATTKTTAAGSYRLVNLPSPATYELSFTAPGYQPTTIVADVLGGQQRFESTARLSVGTGQISGVVTDGSKPIGGVAITTTVNGKDITVGTPTTGTVGSFVLPSLPTPNTYVVTFTAAGYGSQTAVVELGPGQNRTGMSVSLAAGIGSVSGILTDTSGRGLGGATVSVGGAPTAVQSTTLTTGAVGTFSFNALPAPGVYTLTFSLAGYASTTVPVNLTIDGKPPQVTVSMASSLGRITGRVTNPQGAAAVGATVTATDGKQTWKSISTASGAGLPPGGYLLADLLAGTYTVTVSMDGFGQQTALVTLGAGETVSQNLRLQTGTS
ncbi:MAG: hypothetical protein JWN95_2119 [Frankiales bacterium]|nr:hypothetical protein [Frankiales bacterium]